MYLITFEEQKNLDAIFKDMVTLIQFTLHLCNEFIKTTVLH